AAAGGNGSVAVWGRGPKGGALAWHHRGTRVPDDPVREVLFAHKGATLVTASEEGTIRVWDLERLRGRATFAPSPSTVHNVAVSPDGRRLAWLSEDGGVHLWDVAARGVVRTHRLPKKSDGGLAFAPTGQALAAGARDGVHVWDTGTGREVFSRKQGASQVNGVAFSPAGDLLAAAFADGSVRLWEYPSGAARATLRPHPQGCHQVA